MKPLDVYSKYDIEPVKGQGSWVWDQAGQKYLDLYGGHAVISIGHSHPHYIERITSQLKQLGFYSNAVRVPLQEELAEKLGRISGYEEYSLFLCNSGAEATENAVKVAFSQNSRSRIMAFDEAFHGRTSMALQLSDRSDLLTSFDRKNQVIRLALNDFEALDQAIDDSIGAVIVEGIQGVAGIHVPTDEFLRHLRKKCDETGACLIVDEVQSGYGRSGKFFAHQYAGIKPDVITVAKGMGNGFPIGGVLTSPGIHIPKGMMGTTFGGNHLACAAGLAVLEVMANENLVEHTREIGEYLKGQLTKFPGVKEVRGRGLMIGVEMEYEVESLRKDLLFRNRIFTGSSADPLTFRLLPSLAITRDEVNYFLQQLDQVVRQPQLV